MVEITTLFVNGVYMANKHVLVSRLNTKTHFLKENGCSLAHCEVG